MGEGVCDQHGGSVMMGCPWPQDVEVDSVDGYPRRQEEVGGVQIFPDFARRETAAGHRASLCFSLLL